MPPPVGTTTLMIIPIMKHRTREHREKWRKNKFMQVIAKKKKYFLIEKSKPKIWMMLLNFGQSFGDVLEKK